MKLSLRAALVLLLAVSLSAGGVLAAPAFAAGDARVEGVVTMPGGGVPDGPVRVTLSTTDYVTVTTQVAYADAATGFYGFDAPAGDYYLWFEYEGSGNILPFIRSNGTVPNGLLPGPELTLTAGVPRTLDRSLKAGAIIAGTATGAGGVLLESLTVEGNNFLSYGRSTFDPVTGAYSLDRLPPGTYRLDFRSPPRWQVGSLASVTVTDGQVLGGKDIVLAQTTTIEGTITYRTAAPGVYPEGLSILLWNQSSGQISAYADTGADGSYHFYNVTPGTYSVCASYVGYLDFLNCWPDTLPPAPVPTVAVTAGQVRSGVDFQVEEAGTIEGRILARLSPSAAATPLASGRVALYRLDGGTYVWEMSRTVRSDGTFSVVGLTPGQYALRFSDDSGAFNAEYWEDERYFAASTDVNVETGSVTLLADAILEPLTIDVTRISGLGRIDVNVNVSKTLFPEGAVPPGGVPVVYVANALNFPDALSAGPAAAFHGGAVLLVEPTEIPSAVRAELLRLHPQRIVVAGGPASVTPAVFEQLRSYTTEIVRADGLDRYEAGRNVVRDAFGDYGADIAIIATGATFPDALSAGPAAASVGAPVILVDGLASSIDTETRRLIQDLGIQYVYIAGGTGSVTPGVEASLRSLLGSGNVTRFAGIDRVEVAVLMNREFFDESDYAFLATAFNFPDALTGGPLAAAYGAPLYLANPECIPDEVGFDILDLGTQGVILLGGPASLTPAVENLQLC